MALPIKKRAWIVAIALVCLAACAFYFALSHRFPSASAAGISPAILEQLPPGAPAVVYVDVAALRKLQGSPLDAVLGISNAVPRPDKDYQDFVRSTGFDYTRDLDTAAIAFWPAANATNPAAQNAGNLTVAVADGRFDAEKIEEYALRTGEKVTRGTATVYEIPGNPPVAFELISGTRLAFASGAGAEDLLAKLGSEGLDPAMQARVDRVAGSAVFAVARTDNLPPAAYNSLKGAPQFVQLARSLQSLAIAGRADGNVIHLTIEGECDTTVNAVEIKTLLDSLRMIGTMALADPKARAQMTAQQFAIFEALIDQAKVSSEDRWVRLSVDLTPAMLTPGSSQTASGH